MPNWPSSVTAPTQKVFSRAVLTEAAAPHLTLEELQGMPDDLLARIQRLQKAGTPTGNGYRDRFLPRG